jgi:hypothetical protein
MSQFRLNRLFNLVSRALDVLSTTDLSGEPSFITGIEIGTRGLHSRRRANPRRDPADLLGCGITAFAGAGAGR